MTPAVPKLQTSGSFFLWFVCFLCQNQLWWWTIACIHLDPAPRTAMFLPRLTCGCHVKSLYVSHVRVQSTVQITLDYFPAVVVTRSHENERRAAGQSDGFGHEKAHHYGEMEEK